MCINTSLHIEKAIQNSEYTEIFNDHIGDEVGNIWFNHCEYDSPATHICEATPLILFPDASEYGLYPAMSRNCSEMQRSECDHECEFCSSCELEMCDLIEEIKYRERIAASRKEEARLNPGESAVWRGGVCDDLPF